MAARAFRYKFYNLAGIHFFAFFEIPVLSNSWLNLPYIVTSTYGKAIGIHHNVEDVSFQVQQNIR